MMSAVKSVDTKAEMALRRALHASGVRYRVHVRDVSGNPDIAIKKYRIAVFVDGDMWHGHEQTRRGLPDLESMFPTNTEFWCAKIRRNMQRDEQVSARLCQEGWHVMRFWASDVESDPGRVAGEVRRAVDERRLGSGAAKGESHDSH